MRRALDGIGTAAAYAIVAAIVVHHYRDAFRAWRIEREQRRMIEQGRRRKIGFLRSIHRPDGSHDRIGETERA